MFYGLMKDIVNYPLIQQRVRISSCESLKTAFKRNYELLDIVGISVNRQIKELREIYGMKITPGILSELKNGKRYKTGLILIATLKDYWKERGYEFNVIL